GAARARQGCAIRAAIAAIAVLAAAAGALSEVMIAVDGRAMGAAARSASSLAADGSGFAASGGARVVVNTPLPLLAKPKTEDSPGGATRMPWVRYGVLEPVRI